MARKGLLAAGAERASARLLGAAPPAFFIVAACCRWPADKARAAAIRAAAAREVDWESVLRIAARHRVTGFVRHGLAQAGVTPPESVAETLATRVAALCRRNLRQAAETARLSQTLREAGVTAVFIKGATLQALAYDDYALKQSFDIDILVSPSEVARAWRVLETAGYRPQPSPPFLTPAQFDLLIATSRELAFHRDGVVVELQWRLAYNREILRNLDATSPIQRVSVGGGMAPTFRYDALFVYLCVHGAQHSWSRLKWLTDLTALLARGDADVERLYETAAAVGAGRCAAQALLLRERLLGGVLPEPLRARLCAVAGASLLQAVALKAMLDDGTQAAQRRRSLRPLWTFLSLFLLGEGRAFLTEECRRYMVAPADIAVLPLPPRLVWLYTALRAPLWLWRRLRRRDLRPP